MPDEALAIVGSPLGDLGLVASADGLHAIHFESARHGAPLAEVARRYDAVAPHDAARAVLELAAAQLAGYFAGARTAFQLPLAPRGTDFQRRVWRALGEIPFGTTISYGALALRLGDVRATRAVGAANGRNPIPIVVPCHRVIGADGSLTGFGGGIDRKRWLLDHERSHATGAQIPLGL
jgi:methylated-DNA-[protein]-cysteine S-methyltransferase